MNTQVIDFLRENPNSNKAAITAGTGIKGLPLFNLLKKLVTDGHIISVGEGNYTSYSINENYSEQQVSEEKAASEEQNEQTEQTGAEVKAEVKEETASNDGDKKKEEPVTDATITKATTSRDNSKYTFNEGRYGKGPLVRAVVAKYVEDHPDTSYTQLKGIFADTLMKRFGVFASETEAKKLSGSKPRYFLKPEQMIKIKGQKEPIAICNQWTAALIEPFIKVAKELGYKIK